MKEKKDDFVVIFMFLFLSQDMKRKKNECKVT